MVICNMDTVMIPRPPALPIISPPPPPPPASSTKSPTKIKSTPMPPASIRSHNSTISTSQGGFRLAEQTDNGSIYSIYKQKIDSMFESSTDSSQSTRNSVQARIEKMFTDVVTTHQDVGGPPPPIDIGGTHTFSVDYLGSVPLRDKVTSLAGLQAPLRDLYFAYKRITRHKTGLTGRLAISPHGLQVHYQGSGGDNNKSGDLLEQLNSFPTIAVWSAVKFVIHENQPDHMEYAFLPLITDPDNIDKRTLFRALNDSERGYISKEAHSPLFAVVMRKIGVQKQLECHGFVCQTSEDAIVIAATLYKSLMAHMKAKEKKPKSRNGITSMSLASSIYNEKSTSNLTPVRPPRKKRGSTTSSIISESNDIDTSDTQPLLQPPTRKPPKKSTKTRRAPKAPDTENKKQRDNLDEILPYDEGNNSNSDEIKEIKPKTFSDKINTYMSQEQKQITAEIKQVMSEQGGNRGLKKVTNMRKGEQPSDNNNTLRNSNKKENSGDILTKVTIPRSGSFLNAGGLTRYKSKLSRSNGQATGGSPLGFNELFNEFRLQEGLHSMDEILGVIIDSEGMSFNDLKPIYKEFLLKLSVTLTKDELYQRSKSIMRRQKKKILRRTSSIQTKTKKTRHRHLIRVGNKFRRLKHIFQKNFNKFGKSNRSFKKNSSDSSNQKKSGGNHHSESITNHHQDDTDLKVPESSISTSSYDTRHFTPKDDGPNSVGGGSKKQIYRKKSSELTRNHRRDHRTSTSEESDFFSLRRKSKLHSTLNTQNRNSSSGYVSCSECSYDSDTCTCISADKCYCSLGNNKTFDRSSKCHQTVLCSKSPLILAPSPAVTSATSPPCCTNRRHHHQTIDNTVTTSCGCDTDSCAESNKCYCQNVVSAKQQRKNTTTTIVKQLKERGFVSALPEINTNINYTNKQQHRKLCKKNSNTKSTRSLEYMSNPSEGYYEKLRSSSVSGGGGGGQNSHSKSRRRRYNSDNLALDYDLFTITNSGNVHNQAVYSRRAMSENLAVQHHQKYGSIRSYCSAKYDSKNNNRTTTTTTAITSTSSGGVCTEALSVKKSAEIAALFADIKLSQTTDIAHLAAAAAVSSQRAVPGGCCDIESMISSRNAYNRLKTNNSIGNLSPADITNAIAAATSYGQQQRNGGGMMVQNSLYASKNNINLVKNNNLFSARNGLYTIQSQSDESRRSSVSGHSQGGKRRSSNNISYFELQKNNRNIISTNLENSLGYLP